MWYSPDSIADDIRRDIANNYWSFLPLTQYGEGDPILTAEVLYCAPELLSPEHKSRLIPEYETLLTQKALSGERTAAALLALASLDRPVLDLLYSTAAYAADMTEQELLYLAAAFAAAGDNSAARGIWEPLQDAHGQAEQGESFCIVGEDTEETIHLTALALLPASVIDPDTACAMVRYLQNHTSSVDLHVLELAAFVTHYRPTAAEETRLTYQTLTGDTEEITLRRGQSHTLTLTRSAYEALNITHADEGILIRASYGASPAEAMMEEKDDILTLSKSITPYDTDNGIYRVTITYSGTTNADYLHFALCDTIPSGARYFIGDRGSTWSNMSSAYLSNNGGQQMKGSLSFWNPTLYDKDKLAGTEQYAFSGSISYFIRAAVKGTFTAEPALALDYSRNTYAQTESLTVEIKDGGWIIK